MPAGQSFLSVDGDWVVPNVDAPTENQWYYCSSWVGIDGDGSPDVCQAGVECEVYRSGNSITRNVYPRYPGEAQITKFATSPGDMVTVMISTAGAASTTVTLFFRNLTSGAFTSFNFDAKQGTTLVGNSTEWIVEAPTVDNSQTQIAAYGEVFFSARQPGFGSHRSVAAMLGLLSTLCPIAIAQKAPAALRDDPFIQAIETMKHAVAHVDCLGVSGGLPELIERVGSSFFISEEGNFLTAAHVIQEIQRSKRCPNSAITLPAGDWRPEARTENMAWFPFTTSNCRVDEVLDIAVCRLSQDLSARRWELHLRAEPVAFEWNIPPDGTPVAFTGFPLRARDPMTFRADVAAYLIPWAEEAIPELVLDHVSLPGFSGSPVYLADGKIVAILVKGGTGETNGIAIARPASAFRDMIGKKPQRK